MGANTKEGEMRYPHKARDYKKDPQKCFSFKDKITQLITYNSKTKFHFPWAQTIWCNLARQCANWQCNSHRSNHFSRMFCFSGNLWKREPSSSSSSSNLSSTVNTIQEEKNVSKRSNCSCLYICKTVRSVQCLI